MAPAFDRKCQRGLLMSPAFRRTTDTAPASGLNCQVQVET